MKPTNLLHAALAAATVNSSPTDKRSGTSCTSLTAPDVSGADITSISGTEASDHCAVQIYLTHTDATDNVSIITWLPLTDWNGRYQGTGGGGFSTGGSSTALSSPVADGYVAGTTDGGLPSDSNSTNFANDTQLMTNFAYLSIHDMTVVGKALAEQFYGTSVNYSYWNGCSTGGRQGYMEAQRYPTDYQGIYAASPPLDYAYFEVSRLWPYVVQNVEGEFVDECVYDSLTAAAIAYCDDDDGGDDGLISDPPTCQFDATQMINTTATNCTDSTTITALQAQIWNQIAAGPVDTEGNSLYFGIAKGASYSALAGTTPQKDSAGFTKAWVLKNMSYDLSLITYETFPEIFVLAYEEWNDLIGTNNANLTDFYEAGGKLLSWHGWADPSIYANETADYWLRVLDVMNGNGTEVDEFYRLFMAPGVGHCGGGTGATPTDPFDALVAWVENGTTPDTLAASGNGITRNLCLYPLELEYSGSGDLSDADSWTCA